MSRYHVHRSTQISATPEQVFETAADYSRWTIWSPWLGAEPDAEVNVSDDPSSVGSIYSWKGEVVGQGEVEHKRLEPGKLIEDEIRFVKPFKSQSKVSFEIEPVGDETRITWHMHGSLPWFLFWMKSQVETFVGMDYERGLKMLKEYIETGEILSSTEIRGLQSVGPLQMAGVRKKCPMHEVGPSMGAAIGEACQKLSDLNLPTDGEVMSVYHNFDMKALTFDYTSGFVLPAGQTLPSEMSTWSLPPSQALSVVHTGSYEHLGNAWSAAHQYARYKKLKQSKVGTYEVYKNDPENTPAAELRTEIFMPLK